MHDAKQHDREAGRNSRKRMGRSQHAHWQRETSTRSAWNILKLAATDRLPQLLRLKYQRMAASPFGYFRGAAPVMAYDIGPGPNTGIFCQLCGDAHVRNLGAYAAPDGRMIFDINDFDETVRGPFEWDVKRMATSLYLATREAGQGEDDCREAVRLFIHRYRKCIALFAAMPILEIARYQIHRQTELETMRTVFLKAQRTTPLVLRDELTEPAKQTARKKQHTDTKRIFRSDPPVLQRLKPKVTTDVLEGLPEYRKSLQPERAHLLSRYRPVDAAFKVVGTGSVGLRDYVVYLEGNGPDDPLFLQIKQEAHSAWAPYVRKFHLRENRETSQGRRVVNGQRAMQIQSDPFLGYTRMGGRDYLVRQLNDHKGTINLGALDLDNIFHYADLCGELLARGHARSGTPDAIAGYIGGGTPFEKAITHFAAQYADQTEKDWKELKRHLRTR